MAKLRVKSRLGLLYKNLTKRAFAILFVQLDLQSGTSAKEKMPRKGLGIAFCEATPLV